MGKYFSTGEVCLMEAGVSLDGYVVFDHPEIKRQIILNKKSAKWI